MVARRADREYSHTTRGVLIRASRSSLILTLLAATLVALAAPPRALAQAPMVLLLHGGGWLVSDPGSMATHEQELRAAGYRTRNLTYPIGNVTASIDYADAIAQQERVAGAPVIAYGVSAGGTIAAALAAAGRVDGAVNALGPTDFTRWSTPFGITFMLLLGMSDAEKMSASPYWRLHGMQTPQLLQCGVLDPLVSYDQCTTYVAKAAAGNPDTTLQAMLNAHAQWPSDRDRARAWLQARWPAP